MNTSLTSQCPVCGTPGVRFVKSDGSKLDLKDFSQVQRHGPVQVAPQVKVRCANANCNYEFK